MDAELIDEDFVRRAAALQGIEITPEQMPGVLSNLQRTAQLAALVNAFPLDPVADEPGPVWRP